MLLADEDEEEGEGEGSGDDGDEEPIDKAEKAQMVSENRILSQDEHRKIAAYQLKKQVIIALAANFFAKIGVVSRVILPMTCYSFLISLCSATLRPFHYETCALRLID